MYSRILIEKLDYFFGGNCGNEDNRVNVQTKTENDGDVRG